MRVRGPQHGQLGTTAVDAADVVEAIAAGRADRLPRVTGVVLQQAVVEAHAPASRERDSSGFRLPCAFQVAWLTACGPSLTPPWNMAMFSA
ncbi:hypothetical protein G6F46_015010 [Rhizopus delemar]|nr:hypothetical protein G6F46_015010 [Rhizopus delemar]